MVVDQYVMILNAIPGEFHSNLLVIFRVEGHDIHSRRAVLRGVILRHQIIEIIKNRVSLLSY